VGSLAVVGTHVAFWTGTALRGTWSGVASRLDTGVAIFFVLSGFLLFRQFAFAKAQGAPVPGAGGYLLRRAVRILPAYYVAVAVALLILPRLTTPEGAPVTGSDWLHYLTFTQNYGRNWSRPGLTQTWSLATEAAFYLLLPILAKICLTGRWRPVRALVLSAAVGTLVTGAWLVGMALGVVDDSRQETWLPTYAIWFSAGMALAVIHVALRTGTAPHWFRAVDGIGAAPGSCWALALALMVIAGTPVAGPRGVAVSSAGQIATRVLLQATIAVALLIAAAFGPRTRTKALLQTRPARWLGDVSYGLFLWHLMVLEVFYARTGRPEFTGDPITTFVVVAGLGLVLATASYYLMERPLLRLGHRSRRGRLQRMQDRAQPQPADRDEAERLGAERRVGAVAEG
jgi:peptidoglycan/LPS O-acetylase OafA/YrhL